MDPLPLNNAVRVLALAAQQQLVGLACAKAAGEVGALAAPSLGLAATLVPDRTDGEWPHALPSLARVNSGVDALPVPETSIAPLGLSIAEPRVPIEARWPPDRSSSEVRVPVETPDAYGFVPSRSSLRSSALPSAVPAHDPPRWPMATVIAPAATVLEIMAHAPREPDGIPGTASSRALHANTRSSVTDLPREQETFEHDTPPLFAPEPEKLDSASVTGKLLERWIRPARLSSAAPAEPRMANEAKPLGEAPGINAFPLPANKPLGEGIVIAPDAIANATGLAAIRDARPTIVVSEPTARELDLKPGQTVQGLIATDEQGLRLLLDGRTIDLPRQGWTGRAGQSVALRVVRGASGLELHLQEAVPEAPSELPATANASSTGLLGAMLLMMRPRTGEALARLLEQGLLARWLGTSLVEERPRPGTPHPAWRSVDPRALRRAIEGQVIATESALAAQEPASPADLRASLREALAMKSMDEATAQSLREGIADLDASQLQAAQALLRGELMLSVQLPFADGHPLRLEVRRPPRSPEQPAPRITVDLHTDHPALGDLWIRAGLDAPSLVDLTVWASRPGVARRAREFSPLLLRELQRFGLRAGRLEIFEGAKPSAGEPVAGPPSGSLINVEA